MSVKKFHILFFLLSLVLSSYYIDWLPNWNSTSRAALPLSLALEGTFNINEYDEFTGDNATVEGIPISDKSPLPGLMMTPIVYLVDLFYDLDELEPRDRLSVVIFIASILFGSFPMALILLFVYKFRMRYVNNGILILYIAFFGSFLFVFSGSFMSHVFTAFLLLWSFLHLEKDKYFIAGLLMGACFMSEYNMAIFGVAWGGFMMMRGKWKVLLLFSLGVLPFILLQGWYNHVTTGSFLELAYRYQENFAQNADAYGFGVPNLGALYHLSISQYRGVVFYAPILILVIAGGILQKKEFKTSWVEQMAVLSCVFYLLVFCCNKSWYGGWTYGPRYLAGIPVLLFLIYLNRIRLKSIYMKIGLIFLGGFGVIQAFMDKATLLYPKTSMKFPLFDGIIPAFEEGNYNDRTLPGLFGAEGLWPHLIFFALFITALILLHKKAPSIEEA